MRQRISVAALGALVAVTLAVAACSSGKSSNKASGSSSASPSASSSGSQALANVVNSGYTTKGGTVKILDAADFEHLDPGQNYVTNSGNLGRLIYRTLTFIKETPNKPPQIVADLATDTGTASSDGLTWTFHLKSGVKYENGQAITAQDIQYAVSRMWDPTISNNGAPYMTQFLDVPATYQGPYKDPTFSFQGVTAPDASTVVFHLKQPNSDFPWIASLFYTSPIPKAGDTADKEDTHPIASGPYKISSYTRNKELVLVRNTDWDPSTDPNRPALPDGFDVILSGDLPTISQELISGDAQFANAMTLENSGAIQNSDVPKIQDASVKARYVNSPIVCVDYVFLNTQTLKDVDVRKAIALAINRSAIQTQYGGPLFGSVANSVITPAMNGYNPPNLGLTPTGNATAAKALLQGKTVPTLTFGVSSTSVKGLAVAQEVQNDLQGIGVTVNINKIPASSYYTTLAGPQAPDMGRAGWCADWPSSAAIVPPILGPSADGKSFAPQNYSKFVDQNDFAQMAAIEKLPATSQSDIDAIAKKWNDLANSILQQFPLVPTILSLAPNVVGSKLQNVTVSPQWGDVDLNALGVKP